MTRQLSVLQQYDLEWLLEHIGEFYTVRIPKDSIEYAFRKTMERYKDQDFDCSTIESKYYKKRAKYFNEHLGVGDGLGCMFSRGRRKDI